MNPDLGSARPIVVGKMLQESGNRLLMKFKISIALLLTLAPSLAFAKPRTATVRTHSQVYRDRSPRIRVRDAGTRQGHASPTKVTPVVAQGDPY